jgi:UDP-N-acetylglucosamine--N-acetylmuramyl-(pentapeptide) pyrophosphoryl-undecaprenol N-acetylglucosamine transferase
MFPAQALAEEMLARGWRVRLATDARGARYAGGFPAAVERRATAAATFAQGSLVARATAPFAIAAGAAATLRDMRRDRPACVAGFGGYPALPAMIAAKALKVPCLIHEANGVLGRVNRLFAPRVDVVACGTWPTAVPAGAMAVHVGNPVRAAVLDRHGATYLEPGDHPVALLVIGGSQGAGLFARVVPEALRLLAPGLRARLRLAQQVRPEDMDRVRAAYEEIGVAAELKGFFDDVPERLAEASLVVSRAGASSIADISVVGRPAILIPYAFATDDHQAANARGLVEAGGAFMIREGELTAEGLAGHIGAILADPEGARAMARASLGAGRPEATETLAALVEDLAEKGQRR